MSISYRGIIRITFDPKKVNASAVDSIVNIFSDQGIYAGIAPDQADPEMKGDLIEDICIDDVFAGDEAIAHFADSIAAIPNVMSVVFIDCESMYGNYRFVFPRNVDEHSARRIIDKFIDEVSINLAITKSL